MSTPISKQDANQVLRLAFDDATGRLKTDAEVTATIGTVDVAIDAAGGDNISISDGTNTLSVNPDGSINVAGFAPTTGLALDATLTDGTQVAQLVGVAKGTTLAGEVTTTDQGTDRQGLDVQIRKSDGTAVDSFGGGTEYTVDAAAPANPVGATFVMERDDQLSTLTEAAGDWTQPRATSKGALWVALADSAGDPITSFGGGTQYSEDTPHVSGDTMTMAGVVQQTADAALSSDGDRSLLQVDSSGWLKVNVKASTGGGAAGTQYADGAARGTATGTLAMGDDGTNIQSIKVNSSGEMQVGVVSSVLPTGAATAALQSTQDTSINSLLKPASTLAAVTTVGTITNVVHVDDNAGSLTIDNAAITSIDGKTPAVGQALMAASSPVVIASNQSAVPISAASLPLPSGAATAANQTSEITKLTSIDSSTQVISAAYGLTGTPTNYVVSMAGESSGLITAIKTDAGGAIQVGDNGTTLSIDDGAGSITVDGTVSITANSAVNVAQMNGVAVTMGSGVIGTGVQRVVLATDQPVIPISDNAGSLTVDGSVTVTQATGTNLHTVVDSGTISTITNVVHVDDNAGSLTVDNAGTFVVQDNQVLADNAAFTDGTSKVFASGYIYDEVAGTALTENDIGAARINVNRSQIGIIEDGVTRGRYATVSAANALKVDNSGVTQPVSGTVAATQSGTWVLGANSGIDVGDVTINNASGAAAVNIQDGGNSITVDGTVAVSGTVTVDTELPTAAALADTTANPTTTSVGALAMGYNGTTWDRLRSDTTNGLDVDVTRVSGNVTVVQGTGTNLHAVVDSGTISTITNVVHVDDNAGSLTVDNAGTFAVQDSQVLADNAAFTDGTSKVFAAGYIYDEVAGTALTENDVAAGRINVNRAQVGIIEDGATRGRYATVTAANALKVDASGVAVPVTDNSGSLTVDAPVATPVYVRLSDGAAAITALPITDNAGSLTVDGSVTVTQATGTNLHAVIDSGTISTITNVVHVDDNAGSLTVDNAGTFAVQATIASGATSIAKAEDVASADADVGVPAMAVRKATPANTSSTDGDYEMLQMSAGRLWTSSTIDAALPAGTNAIGKLAANAGVTIGAVEIAAAQTLGTVTTVGTVTNLSQMAGTAIAMNTGVRAAGVQRVTIATDDVVPITDNGGSLTVDGTVAVSNSFALDATLTGGTAKSIVRGAAKGATTAADVTSTAQSVDRQALDVQVRTSAGVVVDTFGGGTQYTEDAAAAADPVGNAVILVRKDTPAATVSTDGDNIAQRATNYGAAYVQVVSSAGAFVDTFGGGTQYADGAARGTATGTLMIGDDGTNVQSVSVDTTGKLNINNISGTVSLPTGAALDASVTTMSAKLPATLGAKTGATSLSVVYPTDLNLISTNNSSTATLGISGVFTGTGEDVSQYATTRVYVFSNVASATDGLSLQQSSDNTNWDVTDTYSIPAGVGKIFSLSPVGKYFRVVYTNGVGAQASFRLQITHHMFAGKGSSQRPQDARTNDNDMEEQLSYLMGYNGTTWDRLRTSGTGILKTDASATTQPISQALNTVTGTITTQNLVPAGTATANSAVELTFTGQTQASVQVTGTYTGALSLQYTNGTVWVTENAGNIYDTNSGLYNFTIASGTAGIWRIPVVATKVRITALAAVTGTATVTIVAGSGVWPIPANQNINTNLVGGATVAVSNGVVSSGTQRVTIASDSTGVVGLAGKISANAPARNDYTSVSVTTAAYTQLVASTTSATTEVEVFDSSGQTLVFAVGAAASEVAKFNIFPGGNGRVPLAIPAGSRVAIKALSATASVGEINVNFYG